MHHSFLPTAYFEKEFVPFTEANISIATHALHYGTAAFGGLRGKINQDNPNEAILFRLDEHTKRLAQSAMFLGYSISDQFIKNTIISFVKQNTPTSDFYIRPLVYTSGLGIAPRLHDVEMDFLIYGLYFGNYFTTDGLRLCFSSWTRQSDSSLPLRGKISGAYITSSLAKTEAHERGFDEAIFLNNQHKVSEASAMNIFIVRDGVLITPDVTQDILEGITRRSIIELAKNIGIKVVERQVDKSELLIADEVFLSGTAAQIAKVKSIEQYTLPESTPIFNSLSSAISTISLGQNPDYEHWISRIAL
jgi:branched-chain amino acid aminotransferase